MKSRSIDPTFGPRLREMRDGRGMSVAELAAAIDVSDDAVRMWEAGKRWPGYAALGLLASALGVSVDRLVRGRG